MPLIHSKSKEAFQHNLKAEMKAGKPMNQSLAISYALKKRAKKMAEGGESGVPGGSGSPAIDSQKAKQFSKGASESGYNPEQWVKNIKEGLGIAGNSYAEGGQVKDNYQDPHAPHMKDGMPFHEDEMESGFVGHEGNDVKHDMAAMEEDDRRLDQHGEEEQGPYGMMMADGGRIGSHQSEDHEEDMVGRVMKQRQQHFSKGGRVANSGEGDLDEMADGKPNNFDDLSMRDDLEEHYTGANSGDERGNAREDHDRQDIIARIMASRRKKDRNPHPA